MLWHNITSITVEKIWDNDLLDSAIGSQIYNAIEREETIEGLAGTSVKASLRQAKDPFYNRRFVKKLAKVNVTDVQELAMRYLPLFQVVDQMRTAIVCGTNQARGVKENFMKLGFNLTEIDDLDDSVLTK